MDANTGSFSDIRDVFLSRVVQGKSFAEIGGLWGGEQERVSIAHTCGASALTMIDILPPLNHWWKVFEARMAERGVAGYQTLSGDIISLPCGPYDVTHSSGILYHLPSPIEYLIALRRITKEYCILTSASVPERLENKHGILDLSGGQVVYVPSMSEQQKKVFLEFYVGDTNAICWGINGDPLIFTTDNYVPWWWLLTGRVLSDMARASGWEVVECVENWGGKAHTLLLRNTGRVDSTTVG